MDEQTHPAPLLREHLGHALRMARTSQRRTLAEVARRAGISMQYLSEVERGLKDPSSEVLAAITGALGIDLDDLLTWVVSWLVAAAQQRRTVVVAQPMALGDRGPRASAPEALAIAA